MDDSAQIIENAALRYIKTKSTRESEPLKKPSRFEIARTIVKLLPIIINFKKDRQMWMKHQEGKKGTVNQEKLRKHARKAVKTFIELGPTYIKLGQWLSTRADMLPMPYLEELAKLQDNVPPADFSEVKPIIESELGKVDEIFDSFDHELPLSGASLGQVYLARYLNKDVIVKVSRPNVEQHVAQDIYILQKILDLATKFIDPNLRFSAEGMLSQFIETVREEMDYRIEASNLIAIKTNLAKATDVIIPNVFIERTSRHVLTMEYIPGIKITDIAALEAVGINRENLMISVEKLFFRMLLRDDVFHADPHPGNISIADNGSIILYDFGMVGRLDSKTRLRLVRLYLALVNKDSARTVRLMKELGTLEPNVNTLFVQKAVEMSIHSLHGTVVDEMEVRALMDLANKTMSRFPFRLTKNLALYMRMTTILEGLCQHHKVKFQFITILRDLIQEEGLVRQAYMEEAKDSVERFLKGVESIINVAPLVEQSYSMQSASYADNRAQQNNNISLLIAGAILGSGLFVGSSIALPYNPIVAYAGYAGSVVAIVLAVLLRKR